MEQRILDILEVRNEYKILTGNYQVKCLYINNATLVVCGKFYADSFVLVKNGTLIVSDELNAGNELQLINSEVSVGCLNVGIISSENSQIYCHVDLKANRTIEVTNGNIEVGEGLIANDIISNSDIIVHGDAIVSNVECFNYFVDGYNDSRDIKAISSIYILGENDSYNLDAPEILIASDANLNHCRIFASVAFEIGGALKNCSRWRGGIPNLCSKE